MLQARAQFAGRSVTFCGHPLACALHHVCELFGGYGRGESLQEVQKNQTAISVWEKVLCSWRQTVQRRRFAAPATLSRLADQPIALKRYQVRSHCIVR